MTQLVRLVTITDDTTRADVETAITNLRTFAQLCEHERGKAVTANIDWLLDEWTVLT